MTATLVAMAAGSRLGPSARRPDYQRLPAEPLLAAVRRRAHCRHLQVEELLRPDGLAHAFTLAEATGEVTLVMLERFCDQVLGVHPRQLYGDAYDQAACRYPAAEVRHGTVAGYRRGCRRPCCRRAYATYRRELTTRRAPITRPDPPGVA